MDILPTELRQAILRYLDLPSLKLIRLTSKSWASLGEEYLILPTFYSTLYRNDFTRLNELSQHPYYSTRITKIQFDMGELNEYQARHNLFYINYLRENASEVSMAAWTSYNRLKKARDHFTEDCRYGGLLETSFARLPNLTEIDISLMRPPFDDPLMKRMWSLHSSHLFPRDATVKRFTAILTAAEHSGLKDIRHDRLPFEFWRQDAVLLDKFSNAFAQLDTLHLSLHHDSRSYSHAQSRRDSSFAGLGRCLSAASQLQTLHLTFEGVEPTRVLFGPLLGDAELPRLQTLAIKGIAVYEEDFATLLLRHAATLRRLRLSAGHVREVKYADHSFFVQPGALSGFLTRLRGALELDKLDLRGCILTDAEEGAAVDFRDGLYDDDWNRLDGATDEGGMEFERFLAGEAPWPVRDDLDDAYVFVNGED